MSTKIAPFERRAQADAVVQRGHELSSAATLLPPLGFGGGSEAMNTAAPAPRA